ncbi:MAG: hypothetical protein RIM23_22125 [Coleofasciculus sp. G3-WIS-01]|uniref:hypothetical protein n=1 Tax=Coleofasciculus sp. G3-WIS-01 TaxID=3069528 RepID=UPI003300AFC8
MSTPSALYPLPSVLERVIQQERDLLILSIDQQEWDLLLQVVQRQNVRGAQEYHVLLRRLWLFEYRDERGCWFGINPVLAESEIFKSWQKSSIAVSQPVWYTHL